MPEKRNRPINFTILKVITEGKANLIDWEYLFYQMTSMTEKAHWIISHLG